MPWIIRCDMPKQHRSNDCYWNMDSLALDSYQRASVFASDSQANDVVNTLKGATGWIWHLCPPSPFGTGQFYENLTWEQIRLIALTAKDFN
jgi:hypothetical protein